MIIQPNQELTQAIARYQNGDMAAFDIIYYNSLPYITKCVLNVLNRTAPGASEELRQDIIQDTYMTIADKLNTLQAPGAFFQWAGQIATHHAQRTWNRDLRRQEMEASAEDLDYELMDEDFIPEDILENREKQQQIRKLLDELPTNQYLCIVEYFYNGLKETEVAQKLEMPVNTVKTNLSRAKKKLKAIMEDQQKKGIKLYSMGWLLAFLFLKDVPMVPVGDPQGPAQMLDSIHGKMGMAGSASASAPAAAGAAAGAGHAVAGGVLSTVWGKIVAGVVAVVAVAGMTVGGQALLGGLIGQEETAKPTYVTLPDDYDPMTGQTVEDNWHYLGLMVQTSMAEDFAGEITYRIEDAAGQTVESGSYTEGMQLSLAPGQYTIVVEAPRHRTMRRQVALENRESSWEHFYLNSDGSWLRTGDLDWLAIWLSHLELPVGTEATPALFINDGSAENTQVILGTLKRVLINEGISQGWEFFPIYDEAGNSVQGIEWAEGFVKAIFGYLPEGDGLAEVLQTTRPEPGRSFSASMLYYEQLDADRIRLHMVVHEGFMVVTDSIRYRMTATLRYSEESPMGWILESAVCYDTERQVQYTEDTEFTEATPTDEDADAAMIRQAGNAWEWEDKGPVILTQEQRERMERILHYTAISDCGVNDALVIASYGALLWDVTPEKDPFLKVTKPAQDGQMDVLLYMAWDGEPLLKVQKTNRNMGNYGMGGLCYDYALAQSLMTELYGTADISQIEACVIINGYWTEVSDGKVYQPAEDVYTSRRGEMVINSLEKLGGGRIRITCTYTRDAAIRCVYEAVENPNSCIGYMLTDAHYSYAE